MNRSSRSVPHLLLWVGTIVLLLTASVWHGPSTGWDCHCRYRLADDGSYDGGNDGSRQRAMC